VYGDEIEELVGRLTVKNESERNAADRKLRALTPLDIDNLLVWSRSRDSGQLVFNSCSGCSALGCGIYGALAFVAGLFLLFTQADYAPIAMIMGFFTVSIAFVIARQIRQRDSAVESEALSRVENPGVCATLLRHLFSLNPPVRKLASDTLLRLLPQLKASDSAHFPRSARNAVHRLFLSDGGYGFRADLVLAAIEALQQIGDSTSEHALERLLRQPIYNKREARIHAAVGPVLEALRQRLGEENQANTLLRAAKSDSEDSLLRPISSAPISESDLLLRPGEPNEGIQ